MTRWLWVSKSPTIMALLWVFLIAIPRPVEAEELIGQGEWQSRLGGAMRGTWTATLERSGETLEGNIVLTGSPLFNGGVVTGTIEGDQVLLGVLTEGELRVTMLVDGDASTLFEGRRRDGGSFPVSVSRHA